MLSMKKLAVTRDATLESYSGSGSVLFIHHPPVLLLFKVLSSFVSDGSSSPSAQKEYLRGRPALINNDQTGFRPVGSSAVLAQSGSDPDPDPDPDSSFLLSHLVGAHRSIPLVLVQLQWHQWPWGGRLKYVPGRVPPSRRLPGICTCAKQQQVCVCVCVWRRGGVFLIQGDTLNVQRRIAWAFFSLDSLVS